MESPHRSKLLEGAVVHGEDPAGAGFLAGSVACGRPTLEAFLPEGLHFMGKTNVGEGLCRTVSCERDSTLEQWKSVRRKEQQTRSYQV